ncbi:hypothetical protein BDU57DRAFT_596691 [Ampelomyces quisqualis]|uniref:Uncharacterized protein n=1 Tax=Ampelomyces quisqualis TaxID=50730 RepID=A0A6A5QHD9_AMPQU|nr:hypothetical protein BDU57DRAFT_596691 [Ampelomyces quisqualis]
MAEERRWHQQAQRGKLWVNWLGTGKAGTQLLPLYYVVVATVNTTNTIPQTQTSPRLPHQPAMRLLTALLLTTPWLRAASNVAALRHHAHPVPRAPASLMPAATSFWADDFASPAAFTHFASKGGALVCAMCASDHKAGILLRDARSPASAASLWTADLAGALYEWYWRAVAPSSTASRLIEYWQIGSALRALGLGGGGTCVRLEHWDAGLEDGARRTVPAVNQWYEVAGGEKFRACDSGLSATKAHFEFLVDVDGGAIFALYLDSPKSSARREWYGNRKDANPALLPRLRFFSDIMWAYWVRDNPKIKDIRYFFVLGISNDQTNQVIASVLQKKGKTLSAWPGLTVGTESDEGKALLGSPNGATFAYFLLQHKAQLGYKTISKVTIFRPDSDDDIEFVDASLLFHVVDAPEPEPDEDVERGGKVNEKRVDSYDCAAEIFENGKRIRSVHRFGRTGRSD